MDPVRGDIASLMVTSSAVTVSKMMPTMVLPTTCDPFRAKPVVSVVVGSSRVTGPELIVLLAKRMPSPPTLAGTVQVEERSQETPPR